MDIEALNIEVMTALAEIDVEGDGERLYSNYQKITAWCLRLQELHNLVALEEVMGRASAELKKFRTMILDPTIERLEKTAQYESRKITARQIEANLER